MTDASSASATAASSGRIADGAGPSCLAHCGENAGGATPVTPSLVCGPSLRAARASFDALVGTAFPGGRVSYSGPPPAMAALAATVRAVVDRCGFQVMVDVADQYREPLRSALDQMAEAALGSLAGLPSGLRCADLRAMGYSAKDAVDYWFLTLRPDLMDADLNGIPCETVFADVAAYMPAYY